MGIKPTRFIVVPATEAAKNFGRIVDRVREDRSTYLVERSGTPVAQIGPVTRSTLRLADFKSLLRSAPRAPDEYLDAVAKAASKRSRPRVRRNPWGR